MADTTTPNYLLTKIEVNASASTWGGKLNTNWDLVDSKLKAVSNVADTASATASAALVKANNLSDLPNAVTARTNLGVAIGTNVQAYDPLLASIAGLTFGAGSLIYGAGADAAAVTPITAFGRSLVDDADAAAARATLGAQAVHGNLTALAGLTLVADRLPYAGGSGTMTLATFTAFGRSLVDDADAAAGRTTLGLNNVENKTSATIRGEIDRANVDGAFGVCVARVNSGGTGNTGLISWGSGAPGMLANGEIYLRHA